MKKNIIYFIFSFLMFTFSNLSAQTFINKIEEGKAHYLVSFKMSSKKKSKLETELSKKKIERDIKETTMALLSKKSFATLTLKFNKKNLLSTPTVYPEAKTKKGFNIPQIVLESYGDYYVDLSDEMLYNKTSFKDRTFLVQQGLNELEWVITDETRKIGNYSCTKAYVVEKQVNKGKLKEVKAIAWFTEDLSLQIAPLHYYGLPGAIVSLEAEGLFYILTGVESKPVSIDYKINTKKAISKKQYLQKEMDYYNNN